MFILPGWMWGLATIAQSIHEPRSREGVNLTANLASSHLDFIPRAPVYAARRQRLSRLALRPMSEMVWLTIAENAVIRQKAGA